MLKEKQHLSFEEVLSKLMKYCAYQERSELEVYYKAKELGLNEKNISKLIKRLRKEDFVNNKRFAEIYVRGKLNQKKWGKYKIIEGLKRKGIEQVLIKKTIDQIDLGVYIKNLESLIAKKATSRKLDRDQKSKVYRYLIARGYESNLILELID